MTFCRRIRTIVLMSLPLLEPLRINFRLVRKGWWKYMVIALFLYKYCSPGFIFLPVVLACCDQLKLLPRHKGRRLASLLRKLWKVPIWKWLTIRAKGNYVVVVALLDLILSQKKPRSFFMRWLIFFWKIKVIFGRGKFIWLGQLNVQKLVRLSARLF